MAKKVALNKRDRDKVKKILLERRADLLNDLDGTETEIDGLQDAKADDLDRAVEAGAMELLVTLRRHRAPRAGRDYSRPGKARQRHLREMRSVPGDGAESVLDLPVH